MTLTPEIIASSQNPAAIDHSFNFGKVLATILLGLATITQGLPQGVAGIPVDIETFIQGFGSIWLTPTAPTTTPTA